MPEYTYKLTNGKTLVLNGDTPPTDEDVEGIAKERGLSLKLASEPAPVSKPVTTPTRQPITRQPVISEPAPQKSMLSRIWSGITEAPEAITNITGKPPQGGFMDAIMGIPDVARGLVENPIETVKGGLRGIAEGVGSQMTVANAASLGLPFIKAARPIVPIANDIIGGIQALKGAEDLSEGNISTGLGDIGMAALGMYAGRRGAHPEIGGRPEVNPEVIRRTGNPDAINPTGMTAEQQAFTRPFEPERKNPLTGRPVSQAASIAETRPKGTVFNQDTWKVEPSTEPRITPEQIASDRQRINDAVSHADAEMTTKYGEDFKTKMNKQMENEYSQLKENHYLENSASDPNPFGDEPIVTTPERPVFGTEDISKRPPAPDPEISDFMHKMGDEVFSPQTTPERPISGTEDISKRPVAPDPEVSDFMHKTGDEVFSPPTTRAVLPRELQGAKPRFNIGQNSYTPIFANDIDKALYIIAQEAPSKSNAKYLEWVMKETGLSNVEAMKKGQELRAQIKNVMKGQLSGDVPVPAFFEPTGPAPKTIPMTPREAFDQKYKRYQELVDRASQKHVDLTAAELAEARQLDKELRAMDFKPPSEKAAPTTPKLMSKVTIKANKMTPEVMKQMKESGYKFLKEDSAGNSTWVPDPKGPAKNLPLLESEVGATRGTKRTGEMIEDLPSGGSRLQLGPETDTRKATAAEELLNLPRTMLATGDVSGPLRQGIGLIHKPAFWKAIAPMFKSWASEKAFQASQKAISEKPLFAKRKNIRTGEMTMPSFAQEAGLKLTDLNDITTREEAIMSSWAEKVPFVRRSNRAYTTFLNELRAGAFETLIKQGKVFGADGTKNVPLARELADFVNTASGRGSLGKAEQAAGVLNGVLFAPRLMAARLQMLNPRYYIFASPMKRREALKSLFAVATAGTVVTQLGRFAGGTVSDDPSSADFGKLKLGNTRVDPYGGFQQYIVAANRLLNPLGPATGFEGATPFTRGQMVTSSRNPENEDDLWKSNKGPYDPNHMTVFLNLARQKANPIMGFVASLMMSQKEMSGKSMNFKTMNPFENSVTQRFIPILLQDIYEMVQNDELPPAVKGVVLSMEALGMGVQSYDDIISDDEE